MKQYIFQIKINDIDLMGDEFWEEAIEEDNSGIKPLTTALAAMLDESNLLIGSEKNGKDVIKLISYNTIL